MFLHIDRKRFTWNFMMCNFRTKEAYSIYIQFSLTDPWWLPRYDPHYSKIDIPLYGWLFFYFGRRTEGILYETEEPDAKITDKQGQKYYLFVIKDRNIKDRVRQAVKHHAHFEVKVKLNDDGSKDLTLVVHE